MSSSSADASRAPAWRFVSQARAPVRQLRRDAEFRLACDFSFMNGQVNPLNDGRIVQIAALAKQLEPRVSVG